MLTQRLTRYLFCVIILLLTDILSAADYRCIISYHPLPFYYSQWSIEVYRENENYYIASSNIPDLKRKASLSREEYTDFIKIMNKKGIWRLTGYYQPGSKNPYYLVSVTDKEFSNTFRIEDNASYPGSKYHYREIVRVFQNYAEVFLEK